MRHSELVILGLLSVLPRHGYELVREIESMRVRQWARIGSSTVYVTLERLADRGFLSGTTDRSGNRPERCVYALTEDGEGRLRELVARALSSSDPTYSDRVVGAVFATVALGGADAEEALRRAAEGRREVSERLAGARSSASATGRAIIEFQRAVSVAEEALLERLAAASGDDAISTR